MTSVWSYIACHSLINHHTLTFTMWKGVTCPVHPSRWMSKRCVPLPLLNLFLLILDFDWWVKSWLNKFWFMSVFPCVWRHLDKFSMECCHPPSCRGFGTWRPAFNRWYGCYKSMFQWVFFLFFFLFKLIIFCKSEIWMFFYPIVGFTVHITASYRGYSLVWKW